MAEAEQRDVEQPLLRADTVIEHDGEPLLGEYDHGVRKGWHPDYKSWQIAHWLGFFTGGSTFIVGTALLFFPSFPNYDWWSALLYSIGSSGFLWVDLQEFFTFRGLELRTNISLSAIGSTLYLIGSIGFFPAIVAWNPAVGIWGFILGSAFIGCSQLWKTHRIGATPTGKFSVQSIVTTADAFTSVGVELGAGIGAWCFFFGTSLYDRGPLDGPDSVLIPVLWTWVAGSCFFTLGSLFLGYRHFIMGVV